MFQNILNEINPGEFVSALEPCCSYLHFDCQDYIFLSGTVQKNVIMTWLDKHIFAQSIVLCTLSFLSLGGGDQSRDLACEMLIAIDEPLYHTIYKANNTKTTEIAEEYIRRINKIYQR